MIPTRDLRNTAMDLLSGDTATLGSATAMKMHLFANNATPSETMELTDFVEPTFTGYAALAGVAGAQGEGYDPTTDASVILIFPPAGGFKWICSVAPVSSEVIYGFYLTDNASAVIYAAERFTDPQTISSAGQMIELNAAKLSLAPNSIS